MISPGRTKRLERTRPFGGGTLRLRMRKPASML